MPSKSSIKKSITVSVSLTLFLSSCTCGPQQHVFVDLRPGPISYPSPSQLGFSWIISDDGRGYEIRENGEDCDVFHSNGHRTNSNISRGKCSCGVVILNIGPEGYEMDRREELRRAALVTLMKDSIDRDLVSQWYIYKSLSSEYVFFGVFAPKTKAFPMKLLPNPKLSPFQKKKTDVRGIQDQLIKPHDNLPNM